MSTEPKAMQQCMCGHPRGSHIRPFGCQRCDCEGFTTRPLPHELWQQAHDEFPNDQAARRIRYIALMREHGHIVPTIDGKPRRKLFGCEGDNPS